MTLLTPLLAGIIAAIAIPSLVILYFLKLRRRDLEVSTTLLWKKAIQDLQANAPFQRLRRNILLLLQLLALIAAIFALAQPQFKADTPLGSRSIILIDRSASMAATDGDPDKPDANLARLAAAKKAAIALVDSLREPGLFESKGDGGGGDQAMVIAFDTGASVRQNFTTDKALLKAAIGSIEPTDAPSLIGEAFKLAKAYTGTQKFEDQVREDRGFVAAAPGAVIQLFSDGRLPDAPKVNTALEDRVVYHAIGRADSANVGITGLQASRAFNDPGKLSIFVGLSSTDRAPRSVDVQMAIDEQIAAVRAVSLPAATPRQEQLEEQDSAPASGAKPAAEVEYKPAVGGVVFSLDRSQGGVVTVQLKGEKPDALPTDDVAYLVFPPAKRLAVALVTPGSLFLRTALEGLDLSKLEVMTPERYQSLLDQNKTGEFDVVILDGVLPKVKPEGGKGDAVPGLPRGAVLAFNIVPPPPLGVADDGPGDQAVIIDFQRDHPALKNAALDALSISKSRKVHTLPDSPVHAIAQTQEGPGILEVSTAATRAIIVPFDPTDTNWPLDPGYVLFIAGSLTYLTDSGAVSSIVRPGQTLAERLPLGARDVKLTLPDRKVEDLSPAADGAIAYGPIIRTGIYTISWTGDATPSDITEDSRVRRFVAANLLDPEESDIGARATLPMAREVVQASGNASANLRRQLWPWFLLGALGVVMLEWFVYNRKVHI